MGQRARELGAELAFGSTRLSFGPLWLLVLPAVFLAVHALYIPLLGASLSARGAWLATALIVAGMVGGLIAHALSHLLAARVLRANLPRRLPVYPLGDAAQLWPANDRVATDALVALAGPLASLLLAAAAFAVWLLQINPLMNAVAVFLALSNLALGLINVAPGFPFDGGRWVQALVARSQRSPALGVRCAYGLGLVILVGLAGWAGFLAWQGLRFSDATSAATLLLMALAAVELLFPPTWRPQSRPTLRRLGLARRLGGGALAVAVAGGLAVAAAMLLPTNAGMIAPGSATSVEPMIHVPADLNHSAHGTFMLTTVIPQAPIVVGEWLYAHFDSSILLTSAAEIVPRGITPQVQSVQAFHDLQASEKTAIVVGLNQAGYQARLSLEGAEVVEVLPDSPALGVLLPGDQIVAVDGQPVSQIGDIAATLLAVTPRSTAAIEVKRNGDQQTLQVQLEPPKDQTSAPLIGISLEALGDHLELPFPVSITPEHVDGGPSAGLMFTLTVYNTLEPDDLTAGQRIAGTGTIDLAGNVGPIGGVQQKVAAAERAGAAYFLVPKDNYQDARRAAKHIRIVQVNTIQEAIAFLQSLQH